MTDTSTAAPVEEAPQRQQRTCTACGQTDDHPRHIIAHSITYPDPLTGELVNEDKSIERHLDCCRDAGCDEQVTYAHGGTGSNHCGIILDHAGDKRGLELADHIQSKPADLHDRLRQAGYEVTD